MSSISDHLPYFIIINNMQSKPRMTPNRVQIRINNESSIKKYCESVGQSRIIERERERERERIFIKINRNNDTIIIQCMDYTD